MAFYVGLRHTQNRDSVRDCRRFQAGTTMLFETVHDSKLEGRFCPRLSTIPSWNDDSARDCLRFEEGSQVHDSVRDCRRIQAGTAILQTPNRRLNAELYGALCWVPAHASSRLCSRLSTIPSLDNDSARECLRFQERTVSTKWSSLSRPLYAGTLSRRKDRL